VELTNLLPDISRCYQIGEKKKNIPRRVGGKAHQEISASQKATVGGRREAEEGGLTSKKGLLNLPLKTCQNKGGSRVGSDLGQRREGETVKLLTFSSDFH